MDWVSLEAKVERLEDDIKYLEQRCCNTCKYATGKDRGMCRCDNTDSFFWKILLPVTTLCEHYKKSRE